MDTEIWQPTWRTDGLMNGVGRSAPPGIPV